MRPPQDKLKFVFLKKAEKTLFEGMFDVKLNFMCNYYLNLNHSLLNPLALVRAIIDV